MNAASFSQEFGGTFAGIQFDERPQALEIFTLQALAMCSSHCHAAATLLQNNFKGETVSVLRSIQELFFNLIWIKEPTERSERLERVYRLEADPYRRWEKEVQIIEKASSAAIAQKMRDPLDDIAKQYPFLTEIKADGRTEFKSAPTFAKRMGKLRPKFYHIYCYSSLFSHPTPMVKKLYLKVDDSDREAIVRIDESLGQFIAYTLLFVELTMGYADEEIGSFALSTQAKRQALYSNMVGLTQSANKGYFGNPPVQSSVSQP
ncbi:MAG: DUF5677 domain-containing protein [Bacteroidota bacterium]